MTLPLNLKRCQARGLTNGLLAVMIAGLLGCQRRSNNSLRTPDGLPPTVTEILPASSAPEVMVTATATRRPTSTRIPSPRDLTPSGTPLLPESPGIFSETADRLLFVETPDCLLPCWYGLEVGTSKADDIAPAFRTALDLPEDYTFMQTAWGEQSAILEEHWSLPEDPESGIGPPAVAIQGYYHTETNTLYSLTFQWFSFYKNPTTPQRIMDELGEPDFVLVQFVGVAGERLTLKTMLAYAQKGIKIYLQVSLPLAETPSTEPLAQWCLDGSRGYLEESVHISVSAPDEVQDLDNLFGQLERWYSVEDVFGVSPEDLNQRAGVGHDVCLDIDETRP